MNNSILVIIIYFLFYFQILINIKIAVKSSMSNSSNSNYIISLHIFLELTSFLLYYFSIKKGILFGIGSS